MPKTRLRFHIAGAGGAPKRDPFLGFDCGTLDTRMDHALRHECTATRPGEIQDSESRGPRQRAIKDADRGQDPRWTSRRMQRSRQEVFVAIANHAASETHIKRPVAWYARYMRV